MTDFKILITDGLDEGGQSILRASARVDDRNAISADDLLRVIPDYDALIVRGRTKVTASVIENASLLKVIGRAGVGVDNIDIETAKKRGITVVNAPMSRGKLPVRDKSLKLHDSNRFLNFPSRTAILTGVGTDPPADGR